MELLNQAMPTWAVVVIAVASYGLRWLQTRQSTPATPSPEVPVPIPAPGDRLTIGNGLLISLFANAFKAGLSASPILPGTPSPPAAPLQAPMQPGELDEIFRKLRELAQLPATPKV